MSLFTKSLLLCKTRANIIYQSNVRQSTYRYAITYKETGDPLKVLTGETSSYVQEIPAKYGQDFVSVKMLAAPVNPADINMIQGVYPVKPDLPAVGGNEGCGVVIDVGRDVKSISVGDHIIPRKSGWGTWRTNGVGFEDDFLKIPTSIPPVHAAMLSVNPCSAYRMLHDFSKLEPGDVVIQNGGNSSVGQCVIMIAKSMGLQTMSIVRDRPNVSQLVAHLKRIGADVVVVDHNKEMDQLKMKHLMSHLPKAKLALNCVGGKAVIKLLKYMDKKSTLVTYGGMAKQPMTIPAGPLIFNDVRFTGFWMTRWNKENIDSPAYKKMWSDIFQMVQDGHLKMAQHDLNFIEDYQIAIQNAMEPYVTEKQMLVMDKLLLNKLTTL